MSLNRYHADAIRRLPNRSLAQTQLFHEIRADQRRCTAAFYALFPVELAFVSVAYVLVLHRMHSFALLKSKHPMLWAVAGRLFLAVVVALNVVGVCGNIAAAVSYNRAAEFSTLAAKAFAVNDTAAGREYALQATGAGEVASVQRFCEVSVLFMIVAAFLIVGVSNISTIISAMHQLMKAEAMSASINDSDDTFAAAKTQGNQLLSRVVVTVVFVFCTFMVRTVFTMMYAAAQAFQNDFRECASAPDDCDPCFGVYDNIQTFILHEPAFQNIVILLASPLTLLVALWGMSHGSARRETASPL